MNAAGRQAAAWLVFLVLLLTGCAHERYNRPSTTFDAAGGYRFDALPHGRGNTDGLFVCLAFSGGGTRAAALAYGVMEALRDTRVTVDGESKRLLDEVDCISSVSGGSFTAAYYGLFRDRLFDRFRAEMLETDIQGALLGNLLNPVNLVRVASPGFGRIDMAADWYDRHLFAAATFDQLRQQGRPFIMLNATNLGSGRRFDFTQDFFDAMGSQLTSFKVSRAVAASSAFPFLLSAISLENHPLAASYQPPWWFRHALETDDWISARYHAAQNLATYLDKSNATVHLMDGGLADNVGVRAILGAYDHGFIRERINEGAIRQLVVIVVNARTESRDRISRNKNAPGLITVAAKTATVAMDNYSFESIDRLRTDLSARVRTQRDMAACRAMLEKNCPAAPGFFPLPADVDPYVIEINFKAADQLPDENSRAYLDLPTSFALSRDQVDRLVAIGPKLLRASPQYQCLIKVLQAPGERPSECPVGAGITGPGEQPAVQ